MAIRWANFSDQVCDIAERVYGKKAQRAIIGRYAIDGIIELETDYYVAILATADLSDDKLRSRVGILKGLKQEYTNKGIFLKCFVVARGDPSRRSIEDSAELGVTLLSISAFASTLMDYGRYLSARELHPFGSAVNPASGEIDRIDYVPVSYLDKQSHRLYSPSDIAIALSNGTSVVLLGEYGSGKSRCISQVFQILARDWGNTFQLPFAINLRECWGMLTAEEVIRRHTSSMNLRDLEQSAVRVLHRQSGIYLLDGFDEVGSQAWTVDEVKLRSLRAQAMSGVRDIVRRCGAGCLIAGRDHYFSGRDEMLPALGVDPDRTLILHVGEEFTSEQMEAYFDAASVYVVLPDWLPRRPLICQTIATLSSDEIEAMFSERSREAEFWNHFIGIVCMRDARINKSFDPDTIFQVYIELARKSRMKPMNVGPFNQRDLQDAFEQAVGQPPTEDASVMLQRLPSLGRIGAESTDRQFVDMYILDGLRGRDIARIPDIAEERRKSSLNEQWVNPLGDLGQRVLAESMLARIDVYRSLLKRASELRNATAAADMVSSLLLTGMDKIDFGGIEIIGGTFSQLDFSEVQVSRLSITDSIIERLVLPTSPPKQTIIERSSAGTVLGASALSGLPNWARLESVDEFDSVQTVARIRRTGLNPPHEILVAIIKKIFFQKGSGRKEEALLRGFGSGASQKIAGKVLNLLLRQKIITSFKGDSGLVYVPVRAHAGRMDIMLKELRSSSDELWVMVGQV